MWTNSARSAGRRRRPGQALLEFALFGSVALLALAFMIQIGLTMNYQQEIEQQTFRRALRIAQSEAADVESQSVQVQQYRDRQVPDPSEGFGMMSRVMTQAGATVTWGEYLTFLADDRESQPRIVYFVNTSPPAEFRSEDFPESDEPDVRAIHQVSISKGRSYQNSSGSGLKTTTTQQTTLELRNGKQVPTGAPSQVSRTTTIDF